MQENNEEEKIFLNPLNDAENIHDFSSLELTSSKNFKGQDNTLVEIYEDLFLNILFIQDVSISIEDFQIHTNLVYNKDDRRSEQTVISSFENGVEF